MFFQTKTEDMILKDVIKNIDIESIKGNLDTEVNGITSNSINVEEGYLFAAIRGDITDGHNYIDSAIENGAKAIILEKLPEKINSDISYIKIKNTKSAASKLASNFFKNPTDELTLAGITGTNGKTTLTYLIEQIWIEEGKKTGVIGTIENRYLNKKVDSNMTTPDSINLMKLLSEMKNEDVSNVAIEVSSHALDRHRVDGCNFDAGVFTNLTQDHLDYHENLENYFNSKKKLFTYILKNSEKSNKFAVINIDDEYGKKIEKEIDYNCITYSLHSAKADFYTDNFILTDSGIKAEINTPFGNLSLRSNLIGEFNLYNILASIALTSISGTPTDKILSAFTKKITIPGRLERIENSFGINILVDYAHTPDALENVLKSIKNLNPPRIILVFGCGGDRDKGKRPLMGKIGINLADDLIITSDNPRTESPEDIIEDIKSGIVNSELSYKPFHSIVEREKAIEKALMIAKRGDFILIVGKGHEDYQIIGKNKIHFDDREIAKKLINNKIH